MQKKKKEKKKERKKKKKEKERIARTRQGRVYVTYAMHELYTVVIMALGNYIQPHTCTRGQK